ncbi:N-acetylmuramoyl-L-alanine amidase [Candidatus Latescibacterota bacterium]
MFEDNLEQYERYFENSELSIDFREIELGMVSNVYLKESQDMCSILLDTACSATRQKRRGVKQAGFLVMRDTQASMPSLLIEVGYISNPQEGRELSRTAYQKRLAQSMYDAIIKFKERHERGLFSRSE